jgi:UDP:flavonoid glycosyltransferase YjiC (YdhE family)
VDAVQQAGARAIIQGWDEGMEKLTLPPTIYAAGSLPHGWLLSRCAGMVHHGGFGTTSAALRAGIPALVIPHLVDQFYWGQRVYELGAGPQSIRRGRLEPVGLTAALDELVRNPKLHHAAASLGEVIRSEHGIDNAVRLIEDTFL